MAERGRETLRHGPMKPMGLTNAHKPDVKPYAVVQLRQDNALGTLYNMVGFQTKLKYGAQGDIFRMIPGLENASSRGSAACTATPISTRRCCLTQPCAESRRACALPARSPACEGYVESAAMGLLAGRFAAAERLGRTVRAAAENDGLRRAAQPHHRRPHRFG
jgi:methylenetetrahydrofolate--tRNA-(uracil-5-)-methyltransferase